MHPPKLNPAALFHISLFLTCLTMCTVVGLNGCQPGSKATTRPSAATRPGPTHAPASDATTEAGASPATDPSAQVTTQPADDGSEMLADRAGMAGFGIETNRIVDRPDEIISVLKNGATVVVKRIHSPVVAVRGYVFAGGIYEGKWLGGGLSHLLEHLVAGGSNERRSEAQNRDLLQRIGNNSNAYTTEDHTVYFINTTPVHMEDAVDLVTGWMLGASITPEEYRREYQVVQRELEMGKGEPDRQLYYLAATNRYHVSPARVPVIGYQSVIQGLSRNDVYGYYKMAYQPNNMLFCVAGDLEPAQMLAAVQKNLAGSKPGRVFSHDIEREPHVLSPRTQVATFPKLGQARVLLGFPSVRLDDPDVHALDLLAQVLAGGESSLLTEEIRDKQQLVSAIAASDDTPAYDTGTIAVEMQLDPEKVHDATQAVFAVIEQIKKDGVDPAVLQRAKTEMRSARVRQLQTAEELAGSLADDYMMTGDAHFSDHALDRIDKITSEDVKRVAKKYLDTSRLLTTALFPAEFAGAAGFPRVEELIRSAATEPTSQPATTQPTLADADVTRVEMKNGTTLLLKRITTSPTVSIQMFSLGGLTSETPANNGISNFAMQLLMRGTKTQSAQDIAHFFSSTGGDMTASTGNNSWYWTATCLSPAFERTLGVYADVILHPAFDDKEIGPMKKRILAQIQSEDADWTAQAFRYFKKEYYGAFNSPYQFTATGTEANLQTFGAADIRAWYAEHILGKSHRVLAIYGDIDVEKTRNLVSALFDGARLVELPPASTTEPVRNTLPSPRLAPGSIASINVERVSVQKTDQELAGIVIGFDSRNVIGEPGQYSMTVAQTIAGGYTYPTGYLFETLRGRGLVYVVAAENFPGRNKSLPGAFFVYAGCDPSKVNEVVDAIIENIARVQGTPADINEKWFDRAKGLIGLADAMDHETPEQQAMTAALDELYGLGYRYNAQFADKINAVTLSQVQEAARTRLRNCVVTISTPRPDLVTAKTGVQQFKLFAPVDLTPRGVTHDTGGQKN